MPDYPFGSGGSKIRPALVVQDDRNNGRLNSTIVVMITSTIHRAAAEPTQVLIDINTPEGKLSGLHHTSAVVCVNLFTIPQASVRRVIGAFAAGGDGAG